MLSTFNYTGILSTAKSIIKLNLFIPLHSSFQKSFEIVHDNRKWKYGQNNFCLISAWYLSATKHTSRALPPGPQLLYIQGTQTNFNVRLT